MSVARSFPPVARPDARVLVLGSMPGLESLRQQRYYAHAQNAFWWIQGQLFGFDASRPYAERLDVLGQNQVALWDVLMYCHRSGSLDTSIEPATERPNDFGTFLAAHERIDAICFNGKKAEASFRRLALPGLGAQLDDAGRTLRLVPLPSTSPAHASQSRAQKLARWGVVRDAARGR